MITFIRYRDMQSKIREKLYFTIKKLYDDSDSGVNHLISAIHDFRDNLIVIYDNGVPVGAVSYYYSKLQKFIEVDHLGVVKRKCGYGKLLMMEVFKIAVKYEKNVSLTSNADSNGFYESIGMHRKKMHLPIIYCIKLNVLKDIIHNK